MSDEDKYLDEEYHFAQDPDLSPVEEAPKEEPVQEKSQSKFNMDFNFKWPKNLDQMKTLLKEHFALRSIIIFVIVAIIALTVYRCSKYPADQKQLIITPTPVTTSTRPLTEPAPMENSSEVHAMMNSSSTMDQDLVTKKLQALEQTQMTTQTRLDAVAGQLNGLTTNMNSLMDHLQQVNQQLSQLTTTMETQSQFIQAMKGHVASKQEKGVTTKKHLRVQAEAPANYFLQAVIPGRAWLMNTNGDTLTVREGTKIAYYGVVQKIDAKLGKVMTTSGRVIRFSQEDS